MKVAIWGAGKMGQVHAQAYKRMGDKAKITYIIERDKEKALEFSKSFYCTAVNDIHQLEDKNIDIIDICLPTNLHKDAIWQAAGMCDFIFCEKPVCLTEKEFSELQDIVEDYRCHLMVGQVLRFWSGYVKARELVLRGEIGRPRLIRCLRRQKMPAWSNGNWLMDYHRSGGLLMDLSIHDVDYVYWMLGLPETVYCQVVKQDQITIHSTLDLVYTDCCANVIGSWGMPEGFHGGDLEAVLEIVGEFGMITYWGKDVLEITRGDKKECIHLKSVDGYENELFYFLECARKNLEPDQSNLNSIEGTMKILWAAQKAEQCGQVVRVGK